MLYIKQHVELINLKYLTDNGGIASWVEDDFCDDINNKKECDYDGGDCCGLSAQKNFCVDCSCKCKYDQKIGLFLFKYFHNF